MGASEMSAVAIGVLLAQKKALADALELLFEEVKLSGNAHAVNDGWPAAVKATRAALRAAGRIP